MHLNDVESISDDHLAPGGGSVDFAALKDGIDTNYRRDLFPEFGDKVLTLSTCYKSNRLQRYLIQAVLTAEYPVTEG